MHFSINIPNFGDFADARTVATVAAAAEEAGWDALFVWDHVVHDKRQRRGQPFGDPWMLLTAAALATSRLRLGTLVTPVARRRPEQLARQVATLDALSGGRVIFSAGLGGPIEDEFASFGDTTDPLILAERLDEGLDLLRRYWSGEPVNHSGRHYQVRTSPATRPGTTAPSTGMDRWLLARRRPSVEPSGGRRGSTFSYRQARTRSITRRGARSGRLLHQLRAGAPDDPFEVVLGGASSGDRGEARDLSGHWPTRAPHGGTNGSCRQAMTYTGSLRYCGATTRAHPACR